VRGRRKDTTAAENDDGKFRWDNGVILREFSTQSVQDVLFYLNHHLPKDRPRIPSSKDWHEIGSEAVRGHLISNKTALPL
jgi:hypothetical protein